MGVRKILAGCGCATLAITVALVAGASVGLFWLRGRAEKLATEVDSLTLSAREIDGWKAKANAHPWNRRPDGIIPESRLLTFLEVRRRVHLVYEKNKAEIEALAHRGEGDEPPGPARALAVGGRTAVMLADLRLAQVEALAELGMSEPEYRSIQLAVYKAWGAVRAREGTGHTPAEAVAATARGVNEAVRSGVKSAREAGVPGAGRVDDDDVRRVEEAVSRAGESGAEALAVPPENLELFRKHEAEIDRYAMTGLALLGL